MYHHDILATIGSFETLDLKKEISVIDYDMHQLF